MEIPPVCFVTIRCGTAQKLEHSLCVRACVFCLLARSQRIHVGIVHMRKHGFFCLHDRDVMFIM